MTNNVQPIRRVSLKEQAAVANKLVEMAETMAARAKTPAQADRVNVKLERMRRKRDDILQRAERLEPSDV